MNIPKGQLLKLYKGDATYAGLNLIVKQDLVLNEDVTLNVSTTYDKLLGSTSNTALTVLSSSIPAINSFSGQFVQQGFQVWKETQPIELSFNVVLYMDRNGRDDVVLPVKQILRYVVPSVQGNRLVAPGPNPVAVLKEAFNDGLLGGLGAEIGEAITNAQDTGSLRSGSGTLSIRIGEYLTLNNLVITKALPVFSKTTDDSGYPVKCQLQLDFRTVNVANTNMINNALL